jgi:DNA invertase Pin-like site-specific DNA recombinase
VKIGYARTSTAKNQSGLEAQIEALKKAGCKKIYSETASGKNRDRPELESMLKSLRKGDTVVSKMDRLARSLQNLFAITEEIGNAGANFTLLDQPSLDTTTASGKLLFSVLGALGEFERTLIVTRTTEGRERAIAAGKHMGRPSKLTEKQDKRLLRAYADGDSYNEIAQEFGLSRMSVYRRLRPVIEAKKREELGGAR